MLGWRKTLTAGVISFAVATFLFPWGASIPTGEDLSNNEEIQNETVSYCGSNITEVSTSSQKEPVIVWIIVIAPFVFLMIGR